MDDGHAAGVADQRIFGLTGKHVPTVYIVDDDASVLDSTALMVRLLGFDAKAFQSGEDFLASIKPGWEGCLVVDFNLGTMTAVEVIRQLRTTRAGLPAIVVSSESRQVVEPLVAELGNIEVLEKPAKPGALEAAIQRALGR